MPKKIGLIIRQGILKVKNLRLKCSLETLKKSLNNCIYCLKCRLRTLTWAAASSFLFFFYMLLYFSNAARQELVPKFLT